MVRQKTTEIDWMGRWYEILRERGDNDYPSLAKINLKTQEKDWLYFSHSQMDGVGAISKYYAEKGITLKNIPELREKSLPGFFEKLKIIFHFLKKTKNIRPEWNFFDQNLKQKDPHDFNWMIFSEEETKKIESFCKNQKVSLVAFLMTETSKLTLAKLTSNGEGTWTLPVNLRPLLKRQDFCSNHSSGILINITKEQTLKNTQSEIKTALKNKNHWFIWWIHQIGRIAGMNGMRKISLKNSKKNFFAGCFSYLSEWELPENDIWIGIPPGSKNFPIGAYAMKANQRISFCLKIDPSIIPDTGLSKTIFKELVKHILQTVA